MLLFKSYFDSVQFTMLILSFIFFLLTISIYLKKSKEIYLYILLCLTAICIFSFSALLDPFLNLWDERFHALVAKNLMNHPLKPTLYDNPIVSMNYDRWDRYYIWLHKQPLFLWQIALSFKVFGISEFTLRLPNVLLGTILVLITYRTGKLLVNKRVGIISAFLLMSTVYLLELIAGRQEVDHNDFSFLVYVSLSIWSFIEYYYSKKNYWIYLIGLFSGMAILCKWLVGLLVYFGWLLLRFNEKKIKISENLDIIKSLIITLIVSLPWQILTFLWYPAEAIKAYNYNSQHFIIPIEGHDGSFWYHFEVFNTIYGKIASFLIVPALIIFYKKANDKNLLIPLFSLIFIVYLFFSLAATKMPSFTIICSMLIFIAFACLINFIIDFFCQYTKDKKKHWLIFSLSIICLILTKIDINGIKEKHTISSNDYNQYSRMLLNNKLIFKSLNLPQNSVIFNVKGRHYIEAMFYTGLPAYNFIPSYDQYLEMKNKKIKIAIFTNNKTDCPDYLKSDSTVIFIRKEVKGYD